MSALKRQDRMRNDGTGASMLFKTMETGAVTEEECTDMCSIDDL
jgi:hypothetical protein